MAVYMGAERIKRIYQGSQLVMRSTLESYPDFFPYGVNQFGRTTTLYLPGLIQEIWLDDMSQEDANKITNFDMAFSMFSNLKDIHFGKLQFPNVVSLVGAFSGCKGIQKINLSKLALRKITDMSSAFAGCPNLTEIDLKNVPLYANKVNLSYAFSGCSRLVRIYVGSANDKMAITENAETGLLEGVSIIIH